MALKSLQLARSWRSSAAVNWSSNTSYNGICWQVRLMAKKYQELYWTSTEVTPTTQSMPPLLTCMFGMFQQSFTLSINHRICYFCLSFCTFSLHLKPITYTTRLCTSSRILLYAAILCIVYLQSVPHCLADFSRETEKLGVKQQIICLN